MKRVLLAPAAALMLLVAITSAMTSAGQDKKEVVGLTPEQVRWFAPFYYKDGRQRAHMYGDSSQGGAWVHRVKIHERYRDSDALLEHMANLGDTMNALLQTCSISGEICGTPSPKLMKALESSDVRIYFPYQSI